MNIDQKIDWLYEQLTAHVGQLQEQVNTLQQQIDTMKASSQELCDKIDTPKKRRSVGRPRMYNTIGDRLKGTIKKYGKDLRQDGTIWMSWSELSQRADRPETPYRMISRMIETMVKEGELVMSKRVNPNKPNWSYISVAQ